MGGNVHVKKCTEGRGNVHLPLDDVFLPPECKKAVTVQKNEITAHYTAFISFFL